MFYDSRLRLRQQWRLLVPVTMLAVVLSLYTTVVLHASDGDLDPTFGDAGKVTIDFLYDGNISTSDEAHAVAIQPDGKIVTAGAAPLNILIALPVGRTNPDGSPDRTFGRRGQVVSDWIRYQQASSVVIQPDGRIVIGGSGGGWPDNFLLVRYNSDGSLDTSFGDNGLVQTGWGDDPN
ncbi:MAG: delta-60 repeat domain-containing protein, partial [Vicinamibacteraceae bacterium]